MTYAVAIPLLPLLGWVANGLLGGRWGRRVTAIVGCGTVAAAFCVAVLLLQQIRALPPAGGRSAVVDLYEWFTAGVIRVPLRVLIDPLSVAMALVVSGVGLLIHIYSVGYMAEDQAFARYFAYLNLFMAAMLWLVLAGNLVAMFIGWEGVGLCSYLLIAFWFTRPAAARAGVKAFIVTRLGDVGFLLGIFLAFAIFGTTDFTVMTQYAGRLPQALATSLALLLFAGATGKSAQLPLYIWLPDAMEGPTPVSALIHAATMVTAGVYMIVRMHAIYLRAPLAMDVVAAVGALTAIFAAASALVEPDLKRMLAYSTISQLGYMFLAVGVGAWSTGIFHLTSHAFFKALLFLAAGGIMHALGGETDMRRMGGLAHRLPRTAAAFAVGGLALAGIPPLSGFFSKDQILSAAFHHGPVWLWSLGIVASGFTAIYIVRAFILVFIVPSAIPSAGLERGPLHDPPRVMRLPMGGLAALTILGGTLGWSFTRPGALDRFLSPVTAAGTATPFARALELGRARSGLSEAALVGISVAVAVAGIILAWRLYTRGVRTRFPAARTVLAHQFYIEDLYEVAAIAPTRALARLAAAFDRVVIDGAVTGTAHALGGAGERLRRLQTGYLRHYATLVVVGVLLILAYAYWVLR